MGSDCWSSFGNYLHTLALQDTGVIISLLLFLSLSALLSCSEAALFSLKEEEAREAYKRRSLALLMKDKEKTLISLLIANTAANIFASASAAALVIPAAQRMGVSIVLAATLTTLVMTATILVFCEIIPKVCGLSWARRLAPTLSLPLYAIFFLLSPIRWSVREATRRLLSLFEKKAEGTRLTEEEMKALLQLSRREGVITAEERRMLEKALQFGTLSVAQIMVRWDDVVKSAPNISSLLTCFRKSGHSRIPICEKGRRVVGIAHIKDLLSCIKDVDSLCIKDIIKPAYIVPSSTRVPALLEEFKKRRVQMAFVKEKGKIVGLVTMEDMVEQIVGQIEEA